MSIRNAHKQALRIIFLKKQAPIRDYYFYITKFKYHLCYYINLFVILAKGTVW